MTNLIEDTLHILEKEFGYPVSSDLKVQILKVDQGTQLNILTKNDSTFACGLLVENNKSFDASGALKKNISNMPGCTLGFIYDGQSISGFRFKSENSELIKLREFEAYRSPQNSIKGEVFGNQKGLKKLTPLNSNLETTFFQAHSHIRDIDGMHADEALDELCKIIYTKLFDEEQYTKKMPYKFQRAIYGNESELATCIHDLYKEANDYDKRVYSLRIPGYKRSRGVFDHPIKLSASTLSKVTEEFEKFDLTSTPLDIKGRAFQNVFLPALRAGMGQYFTPSPIIELIIKGSNPDSRSLILDPFCGSGHFLTESLDFVRSSGTRSKVVDEFAYHKLHGIEKSERMVRIAMTDMRLHGDGHSNIRCTDALLPFENYHDIEPNSFDYVFTNPPFGSLLSASAINSLGEFELAKGRNKFPLEILGLERAIQFLKSNGKLAIVIPESILVNSSMAYAREWLAKKTTINAIISLPIETFSPYGANIKTSVVFLTKAKSKSNNNVLCGKVENIGYDAAGRSLANSDVDLMAVSLREHLCNEGWS
jgi:type I restriction enzyme M protein